VLEVGRRQRRGLVGLDQQPAGVGPRLVLNGGAAALER
jgi:hypothetical protein